MASVMVMQGRELNPSDIEGICGLLQAHPEWNRTRLSRELCALWDWRNAAGRPKDMAARTLLLKLGKKGQSRVLSLFSPSAHNTLHSVCRTAAFNSLAIHAAMIS